MMAIRPDLDPQSYVLFSLFQGAFGPQKAMEVCEICGAFLIVGDAQTRIGMAKISFQHKTVHISYISLI
jgi:hypothetical protein